MFNGLIFHASLLSLCPADGISVTSSRLICMICQSTGRIQVLLAVWNLRDVRELTSRDYFKFSIFNYHLLCRLTKGQCIFVVLRCE